jgi:hypothetical protein
MSPSSWIRSQRDRPIAEHERQAAFTVIAALSIVATLLLAHTTPGEPSTSRSATSSIAASSRPDQPPTRTGALTREYERAAEVFLDGYLPYLYGRSRASEVRGDTAAFARSLAPHAPRVPPAMRARHARVVSLHAASAPAGLIGVTALVNDGGLVDYPIALLLTGHGSGLLVTALAGA